MRLTRTEADEIDSLIPSIYPNRSAFLRAAADAEVVRQRRARKRAAKNTPAGGNP